MTKKDFVRKLERKMQIAKDVKKEFHYDKITGYWQWSDRGESPPDLESPKHETFWDALNDAVEPYED